MAPEADAAVDELAELRRRAYGPDGDIRGDAAALARLAELEDAARAQRASGPVPVRTAAAGEPAPDDGADAFEAHGTGAAAPATPDVDTTEDAVPAASLDSSRGARWRARLPWVIAAVSAVVAIIAVAMLVAGEFSRPRPEFSFAVTDPPEGTQRPLLDTAMLDYWGIPRSALEYRGKVGFIDVWTMLGDENVACIFFSRRGDYWGQNCAVRPLSPLVEFRTSEEMIPANSLTPPVPGGSFIRFAWEGDVVNVYIVRDEADEA